MHKQFRGLIAQAQAAHAQEQRPGPGEEGEESWERAAAADREAYANESPARVPQVPGF
jgi:hypothetical protein